MKLPLIDDELASCVACGLCLPHCPTYRATGEEALSPRGRIAAMRQVHWQERPIDAAFAHSMTTCVQCRSCETACPSGVPFGRLMEGTREAMAAHTRGPGAVPRRQRWAFRALGRHQLLLGASTGLAVAQRLGVVPRRLSARLGLPGRVPLRRGRLRPTAHPGADAEQVWLFTGCVMDAWYRPVHAAAQRLIEAAGGAVALPGPGAACCGALHVHAGLGADARRLARRTMEAIPGEAPILVDSAGCGAALKDYGRMLGTREAEAWSARVRDVHEWLAARVDSLPASPRGRQGRVAVQDPCHLRHVQRAHEHVRTLLGRYVEVAELDDEGACCGAGGAYAVVQPELAGAIRRRKLEAITRAGAPVVTVANPGCALHLAAAGLDVRHPLELIDQAVGHREGNDHG